MTADGLADMLLSQEVQRRAARQQCPLEVARCGQIDGALDLVDELYGDDIATWYLMLAIDTGNEHVLSRLERHPNGRRYRNRNLIVRLLSLLPSAPRLSLDEFLLA